MNNYPAYDDFFKDVAAKLLLLGREPGQINLVFIREPEMASELLVKLKDKITYPCLVVEYPDEGLDAGELDFRVISGAFAVLTKIDTNTNGVEDIRTGIYQRAKPAADQVMARMRNLTRRGQLEIDGKMITMEGTIAGNWVGPLHNQLYGWRYGFEWRIPSGICLKPDVWAH
jgi:hypothetical protein